MKLVKSLLLAAPATLVAAVAAQAADLPSREAAPISYVRICDAYGSGFFFIPGTNTCLRVGGYVRAEYQYTRGQATVSPLTGKVLQVAGDQDTTGMEIRGRVDLDARTQTQWGTVQTVVWLRGTSTDGIKALGSTSAGQTALANGIAAGTPGGIYTPAVPAGSSLTMERAFIRFAGITAGVATENFVTMPAYMYGGIFAGFPSGIKQLAYTATFGGGFSSTIAIESRADNSNSVGVAEYSYANQPDTGYNLVGNVRYDASWGYVQLAGMVGNNSYRNDMTAVPDSVTLQNNPTNNPLDGPTTQAGWAIGASAKFLMPMIGANDQLFFNAAYGHGQLGVIGCDFSTSACQDATDRRMDGGVIRVDNNLMPIGAIDAVPQVPGSGSVTATAGSIVFGTTDAWTLGTIFTHYFTPTWRTNLAFQYTRILPPTAAASVGLQLGNANEYEFGANLIWSPALNFDIGFEIDYSILDQQLQNVATAAPAFLAAGQPGLNEGNWSGRLRLERQF